MCGGAQQQTWRHLYGTQTEQLKPWKDELVIFCHLVEHLHFFFLVCDR